MKALLEWFLEPKELVLRDLRAKYNPARQQHLRECRAVMNGFKPDLSPSLNLKQRLRSLK
jgi:hypothetical protein